MEALTNVTIITLFCLLTHFPSSQGSGWNYDLNDEEYGPKNWGSYYKTCDGLRQSPINIDSSHTVPAEYEPWSFFGFDVSPRFVNYKLENNGHSAQLNLSPPDLSFSGGGLTDWYRLFQFHFHWGDSDSPGSEHTLDNKRYPIEMHMVGVHRKFTSIAQALAEDGGLAVLAGLLEEVDEDNPYFGRVTDELQKIKAPGSAVTLDRRMFGQLSLAHLLPKRLDSFYRYNGSLTTPGCNEVVIWTVFRESIKVSGNQLQIFRNLLMEAAFHDEEQHSNSTLYNNSTMYDNSSTINSDQKTTEANNYHLVSDSKPIPIVNNYRPIQELNSRVVFASSTSSSFFQKIYFLHLALLPTCLVILNFLN